MRFGSQLVFSFIVHAYVNEILDAAHKRKDSCSCSCDRCEQRAFAQQFGVLRAVPRLPFRAPFRRCLRGIPCWSSQVS